MKKKIIVRCLTLLVVISLFYSCSQSEIPQKKSGEKDKTEEIPEMVEQDLRIGERQIYSWVNFMPNSENRFHLTGEVQVMEDTDYELQFLKLTQVKIFQNDNLVYLINPVVQIDETKSSKNSVYFKFSTVRGLLLNAGLNLEKPIMLELVFQQGSDDFSYIFDNVSIEKVH